MASTLKLQLFRNIKATVSISLDSPSMMSLRGGFLSLSLSLSLSYETQTELKKIVLFYHEHYEDQLYEYMLKSGEVTL